MIAHGDDEREAVLGDILIVEISEHRLFLVCQKIETSSGLLGRAFSGQAIRLRKLACQIRVRCQNAKALFFAAGTENPAQRVVKSDSCVMNTT